MRIEVDPAAPNGYRLVTQAEIDERLLKTSPLPTQLPKTGDVRGRIGSDGRVILEVFGGASWHAYDPHFQLEPEETPGFNPAHTYIPGDRVVYAGSEWRATATVSPPPGGTDPRDGKICYSLRRDVHQSTYADLDGRTIGGDVFLFVPGIDQTITYKIGGAPVGASVSGLAFEYDAKPDGSTTMTAEWLDSAGAAQSVTATFTIDDGHGSQDPGEHLPPAGPGILSPPGTDPDEWEEVKRIAPVIQTFSKASTYPIGSLVLVERVGTLTLWRADADMAASTAKPGGPHAAAGWKQVSGAHTQAGTVRIPAGGTGNNYSVGTLTFPEPFSAAPVVVCTVVGQGQYYAEVTNVSTTQATVTTRHTAGHDAAARDVFWIATEPTS